MRATSLLTCHFFSIDASVIMHQREVGCLPTLAKIEKSVGPDMCVLHSKSFFS